MKLVAHDTSRDEIENQHGLQYQLYSSSLFFSLRFIFHPFHMRYPSELIDFVTSGYVTVYSIYHLGYATPNRKSYSFLFGAAESLSI